MKNQEEILELILFYWDTLLGTPHHFCASLLNIIFGLRFFDTTLGHHLWMSLLYIPFGCHFWLES